MNASTQFFQRHPTMTGAMQYMLFLFVTFLLVASLFVG